jgi:hypothetical protein
MMRVFFVVGKKKVCYYWRERRGEFVDTFVCKLTSFVNFRHEDDDDNEK